jgi:hypothetical protein
MLRTLKLATVGSVKIKSGRQKSVNQMCTSQNTVQMGRVADIMIRVFSGGSSSSIFVEYL